MKKIYLLLILPLILVIVIVLLLVSRKEKIDEIDVRETGFEYDLDICDKYSELVECIIDKDPYITMQMRKDLKNEVKQMREKWKVFGENELMEKCSEELGVFEYKEMEDYLNSIGCSIK